MKREEFKQKYSKKTYIGDGLYVHFDGYHTILSTQRENGEHWVGLEPKVLNNLFIYRKQLDEDIEKIKK